MAITVSTASTLRFIPESEKEDKKPATMFFRPLTLDEEETLIDRVRAITRSTETQEGEHRLANTWLRKQLTGWENFLDSETGGPLAFPEDKDGMDKALRGIDLGIRSEAFAYLLSQASVQSEEDLGKSE
jgi:hypothetical protein